MTTMTTTDPTTLTAMVSSSSSKGGGVYLPPAYVCSPDVSVTNPNSTTTGGCSSSSHKCLANPNHPQATSDEDCGVCQSGQTYWPCDVDGICYCWDTSKPKIPPAPSTRTYGGGAGLEVSTEDPCDVLISEKVFRTLAPEASHPYTYPGFCLAVSEYNANHPTEGIFNMGSATQRKSELAAFLGNALHESDEFRAGREYLMCADPVEAGGEVYCRPCDSGSFDWENMTCPMYGSLASEGRAFNGYCQSNLLPPEGCECDDVYERSANGTLAGYVRADSIYMGRGSIQLSWNYNYIRASVALTGAPQTFCQRPDLVATEEKYAWGAGLFYWMENTKNDRTCHQSILLDDDFGSTLDNINGGLECPADDHGWHGTAVQLRLNRYCRASTAIGIDRLSSLEGCLGMGGRIRQCLDEGTCNDCRVWEETLNLPEVEEGEEASDDDAKSGGKRAKASKQGIETEDASSGGESGSEVDGVGIEGGGRAKSSKHPGRGNGASLDALMSIGSDHPPLTTSPSDVSLSIASGSSDIGSSPSPTSVANSSEPTSSISSIASGSSPANLPTMSISTVASGSSSTMYSKNLLSFASSSSSTSSTSSTTSSMSTSGGSISIIANCNSDAECTAVVRMRHPRTQENTMGVELCQCYAVSSISPFDECEGDGDATCVASKCTNTCEGFEAYCDVAIHSGDGVRDCTLRSIIIVAPNREDGNDLTVSSTVTTVASSIASTTVSTSTTTKATSATMTTAIQRTNIPTPSLGSSPFPLWKVQELLDNPPPPSSSSAASKFASVAHMVSSEQPANSLTSMSAASQFAMMTQSKEGGRDGPASTVDCIVFGRCDVPSADDYTDKSKLFGVVCPNDARTCSDGSIVSRDSADGCNFSPCPDRADPGAGNFFPVWGSGGTIACVDDASIPPWASGAYLKGTKSDCCKAYSMMRVNECLEA